MRGALTDAVQGFSRSYAADADEFTFGVMLLAGLRVTDRLSIVARVIGPIPTSGVAVSSYFMATLGVSLALAP